MLKKTAAFAMAALFAAAAYGTFLPPKAEAINLGGLAVKAAGAAAEQQKINKQLDYYENDGRGEMLAALKQQDGVNGDYNANAMLARIMQRMSAGVAVSDPTINDKPYNYFVNNQTFFNAYCALGHNVSVNIGAFEFLQYNEQKLAAVIAHELVHGQKQHPLKGAKKKMSVDFVLKTVGSELGGVGNLGAQVVAVHAKNAGITKSSEWEADNIAFTYMADSGYNVGAPAAVWQQVMEESSNSAKKNVLSDILNPSTHPKDVDRRNNYGKKLTEYAKGKVSVAADSGTVLVNGKKFLVPAAAGGISSIQRAYFVAGNLAAVYHDGLAGQQAYVEGGTVKLAGHSILTPAAGDASAADLAALLNQIK